MTKQVTQIDLAHRDIGIAETWLAQAETDEARAHYLRLLAQAQDRLRVACELRASFYRR